MVGASANPIAEGYFFTAPLIEFGFQGKIYPVNPKYQEIQGLKAYPSLREIPGSVDYVISCVPASAVLSMLKDCSQRGARLFTFSQLASARQGIGRLLSSKLKINPGVSLATIIA